MYYFLKKSNFNLESYNFDIELRSKLSKKEYQIMQVLLDSNKNEKKYSEVDLEVFKLDGEELLKIIESLTKKVFHCEFFDNSKTISKFYFNIFSFVAFENKKIIYTLSESLTDSFKRKNIFSRVGIPFHLKFNHSGTKVIYNLLLKANKHKGVIELSLEELKSILGIQKDRYSRFYDLETKVLNQIAKDIEVTENFIWFEKIKDGEAKSSKITGVKIHFTNLYHMELNKNTNNFLREYAAYVEDFSSAYDRVYKMLKETSLEETIKYLKENYQTVFNFN